MSEAGRCRSGWLEFRIVEFLVEPFVVEFLVEGR